MKNKYVYETNEGAATGFFNVYQGKNGGIYLMMGNSVTLLSLDQLGELNIHVYGLIDLDHSKYEAFYITKSITEATK